MATPISSSRPSRTVSTGASAAIGWSARADAVLGSSTVRIRKTVAHGGRRESMKIGTRKNHAAPPDARNRRSQFGIRRRAAAGELRHLHKEPGRPPRRVGAQADLLFLCLLSGGLGRDWDEGGKPVMTRTQSLLTGVWLGVLLLGLAGCGARQYKPGAQPALRLQGAITRLGRGSQVARYFAGLYGAGRARAQADMRFVEASSGRVVMVTADRRVASIGWFGGSDEGHLEESFDDMARDLGKFLVRLSKGEAPGK